MAFVVKGTFTLFTFKTRDLYLRLNTAFFLRRGGIGESKEETEVWMFLPPLAEGEV